MAKSFIKIKPVTGNSENHNQRFITPKYLINPSNDNVHIGDFSIEKKRQEIENRYLQNVGQKMQKKATPIREAVVLLPDDDNEENLQKLFLLSDRLREQFGIKAFQWHIHNDEGHIDKETGEAKYNYHAHIVFDWTDDKGKSIKLNKQDMSEMQTITAEVMEMERGIKGSKNLSLNHHQYRGFLQIKDELEKRFQQKLSEEQEKEIRTKIKEEYANERTSRAKFRLR